jgi:hypothetical protein
MPEPEQLPGPSVNERNQLCCVPGIFIEGSTVAAGQVTIQCRNIHEYKTAQRNQRKNYHDPPSGEETKARIGDHITQIVWMS